MAFQMTNGKTGDSSNVVIQPSLEIGKENDEHEKEADHVADKVVKMKEPQNNVRMKREDSAISMKPEEEKIKMSDAEPPSIHKMSDGEQSSLTAPPAIEQGIGISKGKGQLLPAHTQEELGGKMGADLSNVNIHTDNNAAQMNQEIGAKAFTHGNDIYFNSGQYNPSTEQGKHLLAHELTHTVQQGGGHQQISKKKQPGPIAEAKTNDDARTIYVNGPARFKTIKQLMMKVDVLLEGEPTKENIVNKKPPGGQSTAFYVGKISTTSATKKSVRKLLDVIVPKGGELYVTKDEFITTFETLTEEFRKEQPTTFSNLQVLSVMNQPGIVVKDDESCIETMNKCIENIYGNQMLKKDQLAGTAFGTIGKLADRNLVAETKKVSLDYTGTGRFQIRPENEKEVLQFSSKSFSDTLINMSSDTESGLYMYACSLFNGYHSLIIIVKKEKGKYRFEWKDQHKVEEMTADKLNSLFYDYAGGRYSWRIRHHYQDAYGGDLPTYYDEIEKDDRTKEIEKLEKPNVLDDLKETLIARLNPA